MPPLKKRVAAAVAAAEAAAKQEALEKASQRVPTLVAAESSDLAQIKTEARDLEDRKTANQAASVAPVSVSQAVSVLSSLSSMHSPLDMESKSKRPKLEPNQGNQNVEINTGV